MLSSAPFVLLDDARPGGVAARLYRNPREIAVANDLDAVADVLSRIRDATGAGLHAAGFLSYEAGGIGEDAADAARGDSTPLAWFGLFEGYEEIDGADVPARLPDPAGAWLGIPEPIVTRDEYDDMLARVLALIAAGDIYQANLTFRAAVRFAGDPLALYAAIRDRAQAGWGALVATGTQTLLSFSPELFFAIEGGIVTCRPMKGTARRQADPAGDATAAAALAADEKQRAENLMIVDLMRNDLSRVAVAGSVAVPELFAVEHYPTVHQMTSTVTAILSPSADAIDAIASLFPCGSITGAPKIRAMQVIAEIEHGPRGVYTGAIGRFDAVGPDGRTDAQFNVAIRTLAIPAGAAGGTIGLGGGIVADSQADAEWDEAIAKGAFLTHGQRAFDLIETMAFDPEEGLLRIERHLARLTASADTFGFTFNRHAARNELQAATFRLRGAARVRLLLSRSGAIAIQSRPAPATPAGPVRVAIAPLPVAPADFRLRHKTSDRFFYDAARIGTGDDEVLFVDSDGFLTEGSFTNIFVERGGTLVTPPLNRGLLPGILRGELIEDGHAIEGDLTPADLEGGFFVGNALRGLVPAIVAVAKSDGRPL